MTESELWWEDLAAAAGHARVVQKVRRAAISGVAVNRSELAAAGLLRRELDAAEARVSRLQAAARQRADL